MQIAEFRDVDFAEVYRDLTIGREQGARPYTVINMVSSVDGNVTVGGRAGPLSSGMDRLVLKKIRAAGDALVYGVGTLRTENVDPRVPPELAQRRHEQGMRAQPLRVVISASGQVPLDNLYFRVAGEPAVIFSTAAARAATIAALRRAGLRVYVVGSEAVDLRQAMAILAGELGVRTLVVEGGPRLNATLLREGLVDELLLTLAPRIVGGERTKTIVEGPELAPPEMPRLALRSVYRDESELFLRYDVLLPTAG